MERVLGRLLVKRGHKAWQLDVATATITEAEREGKRINIKPKHLYCSALNKANAERRFIAMLKEITNGNKNKNS